MIKKKIIRWAVVIVLVISITTVFLITGCKEEETATAEEETATAEEETATAEEPVTIKVTSWRTDDVAGMEVMHNLFMERYPNIKVEFLPIKNTEYYAQIGVALETGTGIADVYSLHSFGSGKTIYEGGYLQELNDLIPELTGMPATATDPWSTEGVTYGLPWVAVGAGIYYNNEMFDKYGLEVPKLWSELIDICEVLIENGEIPFAQGSKDAWTLDSLGFSNYGPNFYGGEEGRKALMAGEIKMTDERFLSAFEATDSLTKYYPEGYQAIDFVSSRQMFAMGQAAMYLGGSWEVAPFLGMGMEFDGGWFAPPVQNEGDKLQYAWVNGTGLGIFVDTPNRDEVITYLRWLLTAEAAQSMMNNIPGFYTYIPGDYIFESALAKQMFEVTGYENAGPNERLMSEELSDQEPSGRTLLYEALVKLANKEFTPMEAAEHVQDGLETWYEFK